MRRSYFVIVAVIAIAAFAVWWDHGGQAWWATFTGTDYCVNVPAKYANVCKHYGYWSGFGSVWPWNLLALGGVLGVLIAFMRKVNCHEPGCPWIGKYPVAGGRFHYCGKHHPDWKGKHPSREHIIDLHHAYRKAALGTDGNKHD